MSFNELLGHRLREIRKRKELTQETVAELAGITAQHISNIENGKTKVSMDTFIKILQVLNVSADMILSDCISVDHTVYQTEIMDILKDLLWSSFFVTLRPNFHYRSYTLP